LSSRFTDTVTLFQALGGAGGTAMTWASPRLQPIDLGSSCGGRACGVRTGRKQPGGSRSAGHDPGAGIRRPTGRGARRRQAAGPGLWRISKGDHDLWIFATLTPLPKQMIWDATDVEKRIHESQAVLAPPRIDPHVGFFRGLTCSLRFFAPATARTGGPSSSVTARSVHALAGPEGEVSRQLG